MGSRTGKNRTDKKNSKYTTKKRQWGGEPPLAVVYSGPIFEASAASSGAFEASAANASAASSGAFEASAANASAASSGAFEASAANASAASSGANASAASSGAFEASAAEAFSAQQQASAAQASSAHQQASSASSGAFEASAAQASSAHQQASSASSGAFEASAAQASSAHQQASSASSGAFEASAAQASSAHQQASSASSGAFEASAAQASSAHQQASSASSGAFEASAAQASSAHQQASSASSGAFEASSARASAAVAAVFQASAASVAPFPIVVKNKTSKIKVFTNADKSQPTLEAMIAALKKHKYSYEVLGYAKPWHGFHTRMENYEDGIQRYIAEGDPDALCIFVDGFDAICIKDSKDMLAAYKAKPRPMPVVFGAEVCCLDNCDKNTLAWYDTHNLKGGKEAVKSKLEQMFPPNTEFLISPEPVFANAGFIMGPATALLDLFKGMRASGNFDDQLAAGAYITKNTDKIDIDIEEKLVRNKIKNRDKLPDEGTLEGPGFLHFPGMRSDADKLVLLEKYKQYD